MCITKKTAVAKKGTGSPRRASCGQKAKASPYRRPEKQVIDYSEVQKTNKKVSFAFPVCSQVHIIEPHNEATKSNDPVDADVTELTEAMGRLEIGSPMETLIEAMGRLQLGDEGTTPMKIDNPAPTTTNSNMEEVTVPMQIDWYEPVAMEIDWYEPVPMDIDWYEPVPMDIEYYEPVPMEIEWYEPTPMEIDG